LENLEMKKSLVALAALAATSVFAQSSVTISGNVDAGYRMRGSTSAAGDTFNRVQVNNSSTTALIFRGTEDLGGGMRANFLAEINWNPTQSQTTNGTAGAQYYPGTPFNGEQFLGLQGGFGNLRIGTPNSNMLETNGVATPFGTAIGGGYMNTGVNRLGSAAIGGLGVNQYVNGLEAAGRVIRYERAVRYDTPVFNGFSGSYLFVAKNGRNTTAATGFSENQNGVTEMAVKYNKGPVNVSYAQTEIKAGANAASAGPIVNTGTGVFNQVAGGTGAGADQVGLGANQSVKYTFLAANYKLGDVTVYGGATTGKTGGGLNIMDAASKNAAVRYQVNGNLAVMAQTLRVDDKTSTNRDAKSTGLGADYSLSKRTTAYYRYEKADTRLDSATLGAFTTQAVGFRHTF
jgi:predicted porin